MKFALNTTIGRAIAVFCVLAASMELPKAAAWMVAALLFAAALNRLRRGAGAVSRQVANLGHPSGLDDNHWPDDRPWR